MAGHTRSGRAPNGQFAARSKEVATGAKAPPPHQHQHQRSGDHQPTAPPLRIASHFESYNGANEPPTKKRKLSIRDRQQTTLDHHFAVAQSAQPRPPTKVTVAQPHGQLVETLNGVRTALDADEDELCKPTLSVSAPVRVPQPASPRLTALPPPAVPEKKEDKRTLRSQDDGPRLKSELAIYFPNYEDVIFDVQREPEFITLGTAIYVTDDPPKPPSSTPTSPQKTKAASSHAKRASANGITAPTTPQRSSSSQFNGSSPVSFDMIARTLPDRPEDPLSDAHFFKSHRRAERKEKQLRNIERERAMHEKVQLERILDGLQGHDWLKVLGITGITDGEARKFEAKRDYFIAEVQALVDKFKQWKEQEKKQRAEKEAAARREEESEERETEEGSVEPPSSDLNASAARQLQQETVSALKASAATPKSASIKGKETAASASAPRPTKPFLPPSPEVPITSFYEKRHLRDAALGKSRHGRNVTAFGHLIPEMDDRDFELPPEYVTEDFLRANARERRRRKRASLVDDA